MVLPQVSGLKELIQLEMVEESTLLEGVVWECHLLFHRRPIRLMDLSILFHAAALEEIVFQLV